MTVTTWAKSPDDIDHVRSNEQHAPRVETWIKTPHGYAFVDADNWNAIADVQEALLTNASQD